MNKNLIYILPKNYELKSANRLQSLHFLSGLNLLLKEKLYVVTGKGYNKEVMKSLGLTHSEFYNHFEIDIPNIKIWKYIYFLIKLLKFKFDGIFYVRDYPVLILLIYLKKLKIIRNKIIFEVHDYPRNILERYALKFADGIIAISYVLKKDIYKIVKKDICVLHDGFNPVNNILMESNEQIDSIINNIQDNTIIYIGKYQKWKNIEFIIELANNFCNLNFMLIGIKKNELMVKPKNNNVIFYDYIDYRYIPYLLSKVNYAIHTISPYYNISKYTSPLKIFDYLSCGVTTFAPNFYSIKEIIQDGVNGYLYDINDVLKAGYYITDIINHNKKLPRNLVKSSIEKFSWLNRARLLIKYLDKIDENK